MTHQLTVIDDSVVDDATGFALDLSIMDYLSRRVQHTIAWCKATQSGHSFDQVIFNHANHPQPIQTRHFSFALSKNKIKICVSSCQSIHEHLLTNSYQSKVLDVISDAVLITAVDPFNDSESRIVYCNPRFCQLSGYLSQEVLAKHPRFLYGADTTNDQSQIVNTDLGECNTIKQESIYYTKTGKALGLELHYTPVKDRSAWHTHWICILKENIEAPKKVATREIEDLLIKAEENAKLASLGELAASVGHEIKNPLSVISTSLDLLELDTISTHRSFERIREAVQRITKIVDGLKAVVSPNPDRDQDSEVLLPTGIISTVEMMTDLFQFDGIAIEFEHCDEVRVSIDHTELQQVVVNLLTNAKDAIQAQDKKIIRISIEIKESSCCLHVSDNGEGVPEKIKHSIFEPFVSMKRRGTGLGLAISKKIIDASGGSLYFQSVPKQGTRFTCELIRV